MNMISLCKTFAASFLLLSGSLNAAAPSQPTGLRVNHAENPLGIDTPKPLFGWMVNDPGRNEIQTAYQVIVSSSRLKCEAGDGDDWDTGKVESRDQNGIIYAGKPLGSGAAHWWRVRTWNKEGQVSPWSDPATFETAFLDSSEWKASWIGGDYERYRTEFNLPQGKKIVSARAYISAKEIFDLNINGSRIGGNRVLEPGFSLFDVRRRYCTYDVTDNLREGANAIGVSVGRGHLSHFYIKSNEREFILQIEVHYADGSSTRIISDKGSWKATKTGPVIPLPTHKSELYQGVTYDARNEDGWTKPGYNDTKWAPIATAREAVASFQLCAQSAPPMRATKLITPISRTEPWPGVFVFDMGQKITGWTQLTVEGPRGSRVTLKHGEKLYTPVTWSNYTISLNATIENVAAGIRFRIADQDNFYLCQLCADGNLLLRKKVKGAWTDLKQVPAGLQAGQPYSLKIEANGSNITTSIDGKVVDTTEDTTFASGKVGFWQHGEQTASFESIQVAPVDGWDCSRNSRFSIDNGCGDEGLWINRANLVINKPADDKQGLKRKFTLKSNEEMESYDGGVTGQVDQSNLHVFGSNHFADSTERYTLKGEGKETWEPTFTLHGFRWVEVSGFPGIPTVENIKARVVHQSVDQNPGSFTCSNELINRLHSAFSWSYLNAAQHGMPVDCDQRDERMGWTGDSHCSAQAGIYNFDVINFYDSWMDDLHDTRSPSGAISRIAPNLTIKNLDDCKSTTWLSTYILTPWETYMATGSKEFLRKRYPSMKAFADWLATEKVIGYIDSKDQYGDWGAPQKGSLHKNSAGTTGSEVLATPFLYQCMVLQSRMASELELRGDADHYADLANRIKTAFNQKYLVNNAAYRDVNSNRATTQTGNALALGFDVCPPDDRGRVTQTLVDLIAENDGHLSTGAMGTKCLLNALCENGREDVAYQLATQTTYPSWGKWVKDGITSTCEFWDTSKSHGHPYLAGPLDAYFYRYLAGVYPTKPGYEEFTVKPHIKSDLTWVSAVVNSVRGKVAVNWSKPGAKQLILNVTVPVNTNATVYIPTNGQETVKAVITESGSVIWNHGVATKNRPDISITGTDGDYVVCRIGSGSYVFGISPCQK